MKIVKFYMSGGHVVTANKVKKLTVTHNSATGKFNGYTIVWEDGCAQPSLFSLSIQDIVAVVAEDVE